MTVAGDWAVDGCLSPTASRLLGVDSVDSLISSLILGG